MGEIRRVYADTNALVPYYLSDLMLFLSFDRVIRLFWTEYLVEEICDVATRGRFLKKGLDRKTVNNQWSAVRESYLGNDEISEELWRQSMALVNGPDKDDYPHMAAAMAGKVDVLVTSNIKHFNRNLLASYGIALQTPDEFLSQLLLDFPEEVISLVNRRQKEFTNPPMDLDQYVKLLRKSVLAFATLLASHLAL